MTTKKTLDVWVQSSGIEIWEIEHDNDTFSYGIAYDGRHVVTIYSDSPEQSEEMRVALDAGEDVRDWEDDLGNSVGTLIRQQTTGLRETLIRLEDAGCCYNSWLSDGVYGTVWIDKDTDTLFMYETENEALNVDCLTDEELKDVVIWGL